MCGGDRGFRGKVVPRKNFTKKYKKLLTKIKNCALLASISTIVDNTKKTHIPTPSLRGGFFLK